MRARSGTLWGLAVIVAGGLLLWRTREGGESAPSAFGEAASPALSAASGPREQPEPPSPAPGGQSATASPAPASAPFLVLRSRCNDQPVRFLPVAVTPAAGETVERTTDSEGRLVLEGAGPHSLLLEVGQQPQRVDVPAGSAGGALSLDVGATFSFVPPSGQDWPVDDLELMAFFRGSPSVTATARRNGRAYVAHLAEPELAHFPKGSTVSLIGMDLQHRAEVTVPVACGTYLVEVRPFELGALVGVVQDELGLRLPLPVMLFRDRGASGELVDVIDADENGEFAFAYVGEGRYTLEVRDPQFGRALQPVVVRGGETAEVVCTLVAPPTSPFSGRLEWADGASEPLEGTVSLRALDDLGGSHLTSLEPDPERPGAATFLVPDVQAGEYALSARIDGTPLLLEAPVDLERSGGTWPIDRARLRHLRGTLAVTAADTGEPVGEFRVVVERRDATATDRTLRDGRDGAFELVVGVDGLLGVGIGADGFRTATLDPAALEADLARGEGVAVALQRGWSARILVVSPLGAPLAGGTVLLDGEPVGTSGADGSLLVHAPAAPERIEVRLDDRTAEPRALSGAALGLDRRLTGTRFTVPD